MAALADAPDRSLQQRRDALANANEIRFYRARLKRDITAGRMTVTGLLAVPPEMLLSMKVFDLLLCVPHWGRVKVDKVLWRTRTSPSKTVGGLSDRQRREIIDYLGGR